MSAENVLNKSNKASNEEVSEIFKLAFNDLGRKLGDNEKNLSLAYSEINQLKRKLADAQNKIKILENQLNENKETRTKTKRTGE